MKNINQYNHEGHPPLQLAAYHGHTDMVKSLLQCPGIDVNQVNKYGYTALSAAIAQRHNEIIEILLLQNINIESIENHNKTPALHALIMVNNIKMIELLLCKSTVNINIKNHQGNTPLALAISLHNTKIVQLLLQYGADVDIANNQNVSTLHLAAGIGSIKIINLLLNISKKNINLQNHKGETPIFYAITEDFDDIVKVLSIYNVDMTIENKYKKTPLHYAAFCGALKTLDYFIFSRQSNINLINSQGNSLLHMAIAGNQDPNVIGFLLNNGADVTLENSTGYRPLDYTIIFNDLENIKFLLASSDESINKTNSYNESVIFTAFACYSDNFLIIDYLLSQGADTTLINQQGRSLLDVAAHIGNVPLINKALSFSINYINKTNQWNETPLFTAANRGHINAVAFLLAHGADTTISSISKVHNISDKIKELIAAYERNNKVFSEAYYLGKSSINLVKNTKKGPPSLLWLCAEKFKPGDVSISAFYNIHSLLLFQEKRRNNLDKDPSNDKQQHYRLQ